MVSNTYCVFVLFFVVLCTLCYQFLWIIHLWLPLLYSLLFIKYQKKKTHVTIASGFQSKITLKHIANLVSFFVSSHWSPSQTNIWISRPRSTTNLLWIPIRAFWQVHIFFFNNNIGIKIWSCFKYKRQLFSGCATVVKCLNAYPF